MGGAQRHLGSAWELMAQCGGGVYLVHHVFGALPFLKMGVLAKLPQVIPTPHMVGYP